MATKRVSVMCTAFRDGFQSVFGARVATKDFLPAVEAAAHAGFTHFEAGGGARYQVPYLYCGEDAFDMMDAFREATGPDANLQTLGRGVNVVGLDSQSSDIINLHAVMFKKHGMTTIRNFDALNDIRNLNYSGQCIHEAGLEHEVVVTMMELPPGCEGAHDVAFYMKVLRSILDDGVHYDSVCFKDASGTAVPSKVYETIKAARKMLPEGTHLRLHTHETAGISVQQNVAALEAGADGIDVCLAPVSGGTAQPDAVTMWHALRGMPYDLGFDVDKVIEAEALLADQLKDYFIPPEAKKVEPIIPYSPMPGGALTANTQMMRDNNMLDKYPAVIKAMSEVVRRGGFGTSVTPVSQFYFQQAFNNVIFGEWKKIAEGYGKMVLGYFGKTPMPPDPEIVALAGKQLGLEVTTRNPREINDDDPKKGVAAWTKRLEDEGLPVTDENIFIAASLLDKGIKFLQGDRPVLIRYKDKDEDKGKKKSSSTGGGPSSYSVNVNGKAFAVELRDGKAFINGKSYEFAVADGAEGSGSEGSSAAAMEASEVNSELAGKIMKVLVSEGDTVAADDVLLVMEALKMEIEVRCPEAGTVARVEVKAGDAVNAGDCLVAIR